MLGEVKRRVTVKRRVKIKKACFSNSGIDLAKQPYKKQPNTTDITGKMILLGTGTSVGVPALGCSCEVCTGGKPKNSRSRASAIIGLPDGNLLIDTSPDLRTQLLREKIGIVDSVIYTHEHTDHVMGFDDLRLFQFYLGRPVPIYCNQQVERRLRKAFDYAFDDSPTTHVGGAPSVDIHPIDTDPVEILGATVTPIPLKHGPRFDVLGFRVGNVAYCTDVSEIPEASWPLLQGLDTLVLDGLRYEPHVTHFSIGQAVDVAQRLGAKRTYFTHCACRMDYDLVNADLPDGIELSYDGLQIDLNL
jgi:phosphoribosyl 1,2-cyclic phosphate phosphodiesterase